MRFLSRALMFDVVLGLVAAVTVIAARGGLRLTAICVLVLCVLWVPWDLARERPLPLSDV